MGGTLFDEFQELTEKADRILGYSIRELCLEDPRKELNQTRFTQPALYVVNAFSYFRKTRETGQKPDYVAGHSLGEFSALLAAECFDFEAGLEIVKKRGELMTAATGGGMAAVLNASKEEIESILEKNGLSNIDLANFNTPSQIVISGLKDDIARAQPFFQQGKILYYPLNTSGAFHSRYMQSAKETFAAYLKNFNFSELKIPVISNVTARPYCSDEIVENLSNQIAGAVRWTESIQYLLGLGAEAGEPMEFEEIGCGDVLTKLVHTIRAATPQPVKAETQAPSTTDDVQAAPVPAQEKAPESDPIKRLIRRLNEAPRNLVDAGEKVKEWNTSHPVGTRVKSSVLDYGELETRTEAVVLFGHRAAVYMKGYNGYFDLDEIMPV
jgi:malonyl CoA-acyl carrier protein transacylase